MISLHVEKDDVCELIHSKPNVEQTPIILFLELYKGAPSCVLSYPKKGSQYMKHKVIVKSYRASNRVTLIEAIITF